MRLINLFEEPEDWIIELDSRVLYNEPIKDINGMYNYIYCWVNLDNQWCYVGKHKSNNPDNIERYLGSSGNEHYWNAREIHRFKCVILQYFDTESETLVGEAGLIDDTMLFKFSENGLYNLATGGIGDASCMHTELARRRHDQFIVITNIESILRELYADNLELTARNYLRKYSELLTDHITRSIIQHVDNVCDKLYESPSIRSHHKWTNDMDEIFSEIDSEPDIFKFIPYYDEHGSKLMNVVTRVIDYLNSNNLELTLDNYIESSGKFLSLEARRSHIENICDKLYQTPSIDTHPKWTPDLDRFFRSIDSDRTILLTKFPNGFHTRIINNIKSIFNELIRCNLEINPLNYCITYINLKGKGYLIPHVETVCERLYDQNSIRYHPEWTSEMESIFTWLDDLSNWSFCLNNLN